MLDIKESDLFELHEEDFDTVMADDISFVGNIRFKKPFMIKGKVNGTIEATSDLVIEEEAEVTADIKANRVLVKGKVIGDILSNRIVYVTAAGSVTGDIRSEQVVLENGSFFSGKCTMGELE